MTLASLLAPLVVAGGDAGANALIDHKDAIVTALRTYETKGVDALEADLLAAIPRQSIGEKAVYGEVTATIRNLAGEIIAQLPADDDALVNALADGMPRSRPKSRAARSRSRPSSAALALRRLVAGLP